MSDIVQATERAVAAPNSKRAYGQAMTDFMTWYRAEGHQAITRAAFQQYRDALVSRGLSAATINQRLSAVRAAVREAVGNGVISEEVGRQITSVKGLRQAGERIGNWLDRDSAQRLVSMPDANTQIGRRDAALLSVLIGCGLRRSELCALQVSTLQQREGRWVFPDITGKGGRVRTVPVPSWTAARIQSWVAGAELSPGPLFRWIRRGDHIQDEGLSDGAVWKILRRYIDLAPHDCRRTFAKLARTGGAPLEQIQFALGHSSIETTDKYLGSRLDLANAACDRLGLS